ncbi:hypothetical protein PGH47_31465 [Streptomyces sp. HUAS 31]|uniref:hypothetical protein n=1 Tax=Streptomyces TaxID=1883 RepID=UPI002306774D|nr:hypothetical protein [Streptomyces sp. HUAS 31]WCD99943.1 hypothetical protein PGH47_31465 [Streptomyces sp. HUAS 31]
MGVFARLFRRSKATEEASTVEVQADTPTAEETAEAKGSVEAQAEEAAPTTSEAVASDGDDGVEIPKQQSADEAADSEAGEGART